MYVILKMFKKIFYLFGNYYYSNYYVFTVDDERDIFELMEDSGLAEGMYNIENV